ncbi:MULTISPECIES: thiazole synthase [Agrobacterium]|uniref:Thiazole synthase n=1 Tax=Agrobacterium salinitolerans TaxID=1183413 RepID=A0A9X3KN59_9HYPH|nr:MULTISPECIES: thiazole synthase [Agrobacterium]MCZ7888107.1 thiazole synthase [Agrobacterium salinitolerans]MCZ7891273.1 thiazole synthase [Agrobacterium salinitolerans]MCZ7937318.1 thiazole synthase [Agrobacterium salinitolerans]MDA5630274.1 thiazole synthase [Agrobacterium sp. ST15.16.055]MDA6981171.1 thiazole synthase [Agrobacterium salinitolerans]
MLTLYGREVSSRLLLGTARYPSPAVLADAVRASNTNILTISLRRETAGGKKGGQFFELIRELDRHILPNTAGCHTVKEAVLTAKMARDVFRTNWIKLEVIGHHDTLQPDVFALVEAAKILCDDGFEVFPYTTDDLVVAEKLLEAGCRVLMPWCAPIGSAMGPLNLTALKSMRARFSDVPMIVDAGIGRPSHAVTVMELGYDAVLLNTAVAGAGDPVGMAEAFARAIEAGHQAYLSGPLEPRDMAVPSTPVIGTAVFS